MNTQDAVLAAATLVFLGLQVTFVAVYYSGMRRRNPLLPEWNPAALRDRLEGSRFMLEVVNFVGMLAAVVFALVVARLVPGQRMLALAFAVPLLAHLRAWLGAGSARAETVESDIGVEQGDVVTVFKQGRLTRARQLTRWAVGIQTLVTTGFVIWALAVAALALLDVVFWF